jgi:hypothetical protein
MPPVGCRLVRHSHRELVMMPKFFVGGSRFRPHRVRMELRHDQEKCGVNPSDA